MIRPDIWQDLHFESNCLFLVRRTLQPSMHSNDEFSSLLSNRGSRRSPNILPKARIDGCPGPRELPGAVSSSSCENFGSQPTVYYNGHAVAVSNIAAEKNEDVAEFSRMQDCLSPKVVTFTNDCLNSSGNALHPCFKLWQQSVQQRRRGATTRHADGIQSIDSRKFSETFSPPPTRTSYPSTHIGWNHKNFEQQDSTSTSHTTTSPSKSSSINSLGMKRIVSPIQSPGSPSPNKKHNRKNSLTPDSSPALRGVGIWKGGGIVDRDTQSLHSGMLTEQAQVAQVPVSFCLRTREVFYTMSSETSFPVREPVFLCTCYYY